MLDRMCERVVDGASIAATADPPAPPARSRPPVAGFWTAITAWNSSASTAAEGSTRGASRRRRAAARRGAALEGRAVLTVAKIAGSGAAAYGEYLEGRGGRGGDFRGV